MPGLKSGPISEAKVTTGERVYSVGVVVRPGRGQVRVTGRTAEMEIEPIHARCGAAS